MNASSHEPVTTADAAFLNVWIFCFHAFNKKKKKKVVFITSQVYRLYIEPLTFTEMLANLVHPQLSIHAEFSNKALKDF